jgi:hypothetical protein
VRNILLTGIPRAGTTLVAARLDAQADTVCLNEPEWQRPSSALSAEGFAQAVLQDFADIRNKLLSGVPVPDRRAEDGSALTNYYESGTKKNFVMYPLVRNGLSQNFTLAMKHNGPYLAVLPQLIATGAFEIQAVIRHPLPVLRSWRRLALPISRGEMPNATRYWPEMRALTSEKMDLLEKQARMYELMFLRILEHQPKLTLLRYEHMQHSTPGIQESEKTTAEDDAILVAIRSYAPTALKIYGNN